MKRALRRQAADSVAIANASEDVRARNPHVYPPAPKAEKRPAATSGPRFKSKAEERYAAELEVRKRSGDIRDWKYEAVTLVIGDDGARKARYTPDFLVEHMVGYLECVEVKGPYCREAAKVRFKVAVERYPGFVWTWAEWRGGIFHIRQHRGSRC